MDTIFLGITVSNAKHPYTYAALDSNRRLIAQGTGELLEVLAFISGIESVVAAVAAPAALNSGLMAQESIRIEIDPPPAPGKFTDLRVSEYQIRQRSLASFHTPAAEASCKSSTIQGFTLHHNLQLAGFSSFPSSEPRQVLETHPEASFVALLGNKLLSPAILEGRLQRQLILYENELPVPDPMRFFEEVTSFRLKHGSLPVENVCTPSEISSLMAAFVAWLVINRPGKFAQFGDPREGLIFLPTPAAPLIQSQSAAHPFQNKAYPLPLVEMEFENGPPKPSRPFGNPGGNLD